jgi:hypothetical protein
MLKADATQAVAMVLHELTTNAAKYGAFSNPSGRVRLKWRWQANGESSCLLIDWREVGGLPVVPPKRSGYGTCVVRELIPFELGGTVNLAFARDGLRCRWKFLLIGSALAARQILRSKSRVHIQLDGDGHWRTVSRWFVAQRLQEEVGVVADTAFTATGSFPFCIAVTILAALPGYAALAAVQAMLVTAGRN